MQFKSICLGLNFDEASPPPGEESRAAETYALDFCAREGAHLSVFIGAPLTSIPSADFIPLAHTIVDEINAERRKHVDEAQQWLTNAAAARSVSIEFHIVQQAFADTNTFIAAAARPNDVVVLARPVNAISLDRTLTEAMLFTSGRPVIVVPPYWDGGAVFDNVAVAWDGSARAARAVGDAMPLLSGAGRVEILCVSSEASKDIIGADLAAHLSRHCRKVIVTQLQTHHRDVPKTLHDHATAAGATLFVMGAYAHPRLLQMVVGGVTSSMLAEAELPVFMSY